MLQDFASEMSAFSRGLVRGQRLAAESPTFMTPSRSCKHAALQVRFSSTSLYSGARSRRTHQTIHLQLVYLRQAIRRKTTSTPVTKSSRLQSSRARSFVDLLAQRGPTTLYEGPSHFWLRVSSLSAGLFCIGYTINNYLIAFIDPPKDLPRWVPQAYAAGCLFTITMGCWFILGAAHIVRSVRAVPTAMLRTGGRAVATREAGPGVATKAAGAMQNTAQTATAPPQSRNTFTKGITKKLAAKLAASNSPILLEVAVSRIAPFRQPRTILALPEDITLTVPLQIALSTQANVGADAANQAEAEKKAAQRKHDLANVMTLPFRQLGRGVSNMVAGFRRGMLREGFVKMTVDGRQYRIDITGGFVLDGGKALDRLVNIEKGQGV